jgi:hypothetical protein
MAKKPMAKALVRREAVPADTSIVGVMGRMALNPKLTPEKLEKLIGLQLKVDAINAERAFEAAYLAMQPRIPRISKRWQITNKEGRVQSRYAKYEDIRKVVDPILAAFGFTLAFETNWPDGKMEIVGILKHTAGHARRSAFRSEADASGGKNAIQGIGSARSYGQRYNVKDLLAIVEEGEDDDGRQMAKRTKTATVPPSVADDLITVQERAHIVDLVQSCGRSEQDVKAWLAYRYGVGGTKEITRAQFPEICAAIEAPGVLK